MAIQIYINIRLTIDKNVTYVVLMNRGETYKTTHRPARRGKDYYVTLINDKKKVEKIIKIPEKNIKRIEHVIEYLEMNR